MTHKNISMNAVRAALESAPEALVTERELGVRTGLDLTTVWVATRRLQKLGIAKGEPRLLGPRRHGEKPGQRWAWGLA